MQSTSSMPAPAANLSQANGGHSRILTKDSVGSRAMNSLQCLSGRLFASLAVVLLAATADASIITVPGDQPTIQAGIDAAVNGDEVVVDIGTYNESINFNGKAITVRSTDPDDPDVVASTVVNSGSLYVVRCVNGEGAGTVLSGLVITGNAITTGGGMRIAGSSPTVTRCTFSANSGVGMRNLNRSSPTVTNCAFVENTRSGMYNDGSSPIVSTCTFTGNSAADGGGMHNRAGASPTVDNCLFTANTASGGAGMINKNSSPLVTNCTFSENVAGHSGGGMHNTGGSPTIRNCQFLGNSAMDDNKFGNENAAGGGMWNNAGSLTVENCAFVANQCRASISAEGGGMYNWNSSPNTINCTFTTNNVLVVVGQFGGSANARGAGMFNSSASSNPALINCFFATNSATVYNKSGETPGDGGGIYSLDGVPVLSGTSFCMNSPNDIDGAWTDNGSNSFNNCDNLCPPTSKCDADVNGDGVVNVNDLLEVLAAWGPCL